MTRSKWITPSIRIIYVCILLSFAVSFTLSPIHFMPRQFGTMWKTKAARSEDKWLDPWTHSECVCMCVFALRQLIPKSCIRNYSHTHKRARAFILTHFDTKCSNTKFVSSFSCTFFSFFCPHTMCLYVENPICLCQCARLLPIHFGRRRFGKKNDSEKSEEKKPSPYSTCTHTHTLARTKRNNKIIHVVFVLFLFDGDTDTVTAENFPYSILISFPSSLICICKLFKRKGRVWLHTINMHAPVKTITRDCVVNLIGNARKRWERSTEIQITHYDNTTHHLHTLISLSKFNHKFIQA